MTATTMTDTEGYRRPLDDRRPLFPGIDIAGLVVAAIMALGPLTAYAVGM